VIGFLDSKQFLVGMRWLASLCPDSGEHCTKQNLTRDTFLLNLPNESSALHLVPHGNSGIKIGEGCFYHQFRKQTEKPMPVHLSLSRTPYCIIS